jgi:ERCC4-related helicase
MMPIRKGSYIKIKVINKKNPYKNVEILKSLLEFYTFRKTQDDVIGFPPTMISERYVELGDMQRRLYDSIQSEVYDKIAKVPEKALNLDKIIVNTLRLKQVLSHPLLLQEDMPSAKFEYLDMLLSEILDEDKNQKVVVFSCFRDTLNMLTEKYEDKYGAVIFAGIDHSLTQEQRDKNESDFINDLNTRVFFANSALGVGANWGMARTAIFLDLPNYPIEWKQSVGRITRRDSKGTSVIIPLLGDKTIDTFLWKSLFSKINLSDNLIRADKELEFDKDALLGKLND